MKPRPFTDPRYTPARMSEPDRAAVQSGALDVLAYLGTGENPERPVRKKRTKAEQATNPYEHTIQAAVVRQLEAMLAPGYLVQGHVQERKGEIAGARAKRAGQKAGFPDIQVLGDGRVWLIEMKDAKGRKTESQRHLHPKIEKTGVPLLPICRSVEEAIVFLRANGARFTRSHAA